MIKPLQLIQPHEKVRFKILIVGVGANGSHFFRQLTQMIRMYFDTEDYFSAAFDVELIIADADKVEKKKLEQSSFSPRRYW